MSGPTTIQWTDLSWNPVAGCTPATDGCDNCYAFALHDMRHAAYQRHGGVYPKTGKPMPKQYALPFAQVQLLPDRLEWPLHQKQPKKIFVNSMSDLFHSQVPEAYIQQVFNTMRKAHWHTFQVLTKRSGRLRQLAPRIDWPENVWMGVSVENDVMTARINALRGCGALITFLSCEPLLGPLLSLNLQGVDWVITGGESGPNARPCDPEWVRAIRDRCLADGVAFFHKQWGGRQAKAGGRELDGRTWDEFPHGRS